MIPEDLAMTVPTPPSGVQNTEDDDYVTELSNQGDIQQIETRETRTSGAEIR